jgi:hypothetical protein
MRQDAAACCGLYVPGRVRVEIANRFHTLITDTRIDKSTISFSLKCFFTLS